MLATLNRTETAAAQPAVQPLTLGHCVRLFNELMDSTNGDPRGVELESIMQSGQYVAIHEEPDGSSRARLVYFRTDWLGRHQVFRTPADALRYAIAHGYRRRADGAMDSLANTPAWRNCIAYADLVRLYAIGTINAAEFGERVKSLDSV